MSGYNLLTAKRTDDNRIQDSKASRKKPFTKERKKETGERLKALRNAKGLTVESAAELFGVSGGTIKEIERGNSLTKDNMIDLCELYGCSMPQFYPEDLLRYFVPDIRTIKKMDTKDLLLLQLLASQELCRRQGIEG